MAWDVMKVHASRRQSLSTITDGRTSDSYQVNYHGQTAAHMDMWCHFFENAGAVDARACLRRRFALDAGDPRLPPDR